MAEKKSSDAEARSAAEIVERSAVFDPVQLGDLKLANRIVMAPLTRSRSDDGGIPPRYAADYYAKRADAGLVVAEATNVSPQARGYALTPGIWSDAQVEAWRPVVEAVHTRGGAFFLQLYHGGRISHPDLHDGALPVAPSALKPNGKAFTNDGLKDFVVPRVLETDEIDGLVAEFAHAARQAKVAGFDGVEIHSANNYLLDQFIRDTTNRRDDCYGGPVGNRLRFPLDVVRAVADVWGPKRVGVRISPLAIEPGGAAVDGNPAATYGAYADALSSLGLLYIHCVGNDAQREPDASLVDFRALRRRFDGAWIANNGYNLEHAERAIANGDADLVSFGRPFIANPDLVERMRSGAPLAEAPRRYWYGGDAVGYADWPTMA